MTQRHYDDADTRTYRFPAAALASAGVVGRFQGPAGLSGRVRGFEYLVTTDVTTAPSTVTIDTNAGVATPFASSVPVATANEGGAATRAELYAQGEQLLPADTVVEVQVGGEAAAGAADLIVTVDWF